MRFPTRILLSVLILLAAPAAAGAAQIVTLRPSPEAEGATVTLGDLFDGAGEAAGVVVTRAPEPGAEISVDAQWLRGAAAREGLQWDNPIGLARVTVGRAARAVGRDALTALVEDALPHDRPRLRYDITLNGAASLHAPLDAVGGPELISIDYQDRTGAFSAMIAPHGGADAVRVSGRAEAMVEVPAVIRGVPAGERVGSADLIWVETKAARLPADALLDFAEIEGLEAKRTLRPGTPIRAYDVKTPAAIAKGDLITVFYQRPGLTLAAQGRALEEAPLGASIRVLNLQSNRVIEAVAEGPGRARVDTPRLYADAAQGALQ